MLEQELLTPRYEVHGWELRPILLRRDEGRGRGTRHKCNASDKFCWQRRHCHPRTLCALALTSRRLKRCRKSGSSSFRKRQRKFGKALETYRHAKGTYPSPDEALRELVAAKLLTERDIRDPLGNPLRLQPLDNFRYGLSVGMRRLGRQV
jgi:hypothetical protein